MLFVGGTLSVTSWQAQAGEQFRFACRPTVIASEAKQSMLRLAKR
jgi:hypothetical protein